MSPVVAVAGGSKGLGRAIVHALKKDGRFEVLILSRKENPRIEEETGARVLAADYSSIVKLTTLLEANAVEVLIVTANTMGDPTPEFNMIKAATNSRTTKRFIPNAWSGVHFKDEPRFQSFPIAIPRLQVIEELKRSELEFTAIYPGLFMEYTVEGLPSYIEAYPLMIDTKHNVAAVPVNGEGKVTLTYTGDIAKYVTKLLSLEKWEQSYHIVGDIKSWNEIVQAAEKGKGVKFKVYYDPIEKLKQGEVTELPGYDSVYEAFGEKGTTRPLVQALFAQYGLWMEEGLFVYEGEAELNEIFPEIKAMTLKEAWDLAVGTAEVS